MHFESHQLRHPSYFEALRTRLRTDAAMQRALEQVILAALQLPSLTSVTQPDYMRAFRGWMDQEITDRDTVQDNISSNFLLEATLHIAVDYRYITSAVDAQLMDLLARSSKIEHVAYALVKLLRPAFLGLTEGLQRSLLDLANRTDSKFDQVHMHLALTILDAHDRLPRAMQSAAAKAFEKLLHTSSFPVAWAIVAAVCNGKLESITFHETPELPSQACSLLEQHGRILNILSVGDRLARAAMAACFAHGRNRDLPDADAIAARLSRDPDPYVRDVLAKGLHETNYEWL